MKKRLFAIMLTICMVVLSASTVLAADSEVSGASELQRAINSDTVEIIKLAADIDTTELIKIEAGKDIILDLNGHTLTRNAGSATVWVFEAGKLTVTDSSESKNGTIKNTVQHALCNMGTLVVESGNFIGNYALYNGSYSSASATATLNGGTFSYINDGEGYSIANCSNMTISGANVNDYLATSGKLEMKSGSVENLYANEPDQGVASGTNTTVSGGTVSNLLTAEGNPVSVGGNATVTSTDAVAKVGTSYYADLQDAVDAAKDGGVVTVLTDITLTDCITIKEGMNVTIEGAGKTITGADGKDVFYVTGGKLTLGEGLNVHAPTDCCIYIRGGEVVTAANLTKAGTKFSVIQGNGQYSGDVTITGGVVENQIPDKCAIYWPQNGKLTISGGVITGGTGIRLSSGSLEITGGTINANGTKQEYVASNGGSVVDTGEAVMIENIGGTSGYEAITSVSIKGGTFNSANAAAVGSYDAGVDENVDAVDNFITGGTYSDESAESYLADGYTLDSYKDSNGTIIYGAKPVYTVNIICTPSDASIVVMDSDNKQVTAESDGTYMLVDGTYTYSVSKDGYDTKTDSFTVDGADQSITVELSEIEYNQGDSDLDKDGEQGDSDLDKDDEQSGDNQEDDATTSDDDADSETDDEAEDTQSVKTADNANIGFPIMMLFAAMATMVVTLISRKRNR